ncbi:MAG: beta-ketoacyl synthase N-terminal-like domain-containing protein, partial [Nocardioidaceae bacterium]
VVALGDYRDVRNDKATGDAASAGVEQIAIVGMAARLPGASTLSAFWENLVTGADGSHGTTAEAGRLEDLDAFDAGFFGITAREAELMAPAQRLFLEVCHHALESGGYAGGGAGRIGLFAGSGSTDGAAPDQPDFLATRVAHRLGLTGPAIGVQTAGSSALVAVHLACQALRSGDADLALAGAAAVQVPTATDSPADETAGSSGVAAVLLKRLDKALADGDTVHAVIRGSAASESTSQTSEAASQATTEAAGRATSEVAGQVEVVGQALEQAGVGAASIGYTEVDDAGLAGLLKVVLMLTHRTVVGTEPREWTADGIPLRAGVSSLGGTNAHVILEEAPPVTRPGTDGPVVLALSAAGPDALAEVRDLLREELSSDDEHRLIDVAGTIA